MKGQIEFRDVSAEYSLTSQPVLRDISLTIAPGTKLGICGRTGSGKSSFILAILRMIEIQRGELTIDGVSLQACPRNVVRSKVTVIPQDLFLISDRSVRDNLTGFNTNCRDNEQKILDPLEKDRLGESIDSRAEGLDAKIGDTSLSAG